MDRYKDHVHVNHFNTSSKWPPGNIVVAVPTTLHQFVIEKCIAEEASVVIGSRLEQLHVVIYHFVVQPGETSQALNLSWCHLYIKVICHDIVVPSTQNPTDILLLLNG